MTPALGHFHRPSSSQALAYDIFFPLYPTVPPLYRDTRHLLGLHGDASAEIDFEDELRDGDGPSIEVMIIVAGDSSHRDRGQVDRGILRARRHDTRHVQKLDAVYRPGGAASRLRVGSGTVLPQLQLFRNLAQLDRAGMIPFSCSFHGAALNFGSLRTHGAPRKISALSAGGYVS